ncbi:MAG: esterase/lipase family protein [Anaerolineales bacterium]
MSVTHSKTETVILLHGAGRSPRSMGRMAKALSRQGYRVHNLGYPSRRLPIEGLAEHIGEQVSKLQLDQQTKIYFVTHSLGGLVLRYYLKYDRSLNLGRVVMLAPPNQGAVLVDIFRQVPFVDWILGPVGGQIGSDSDSLPNTLGPADYEVGVIAGNRSFNPLFSPLIPGPDDGRVAVESTKLAGMTDFLVLPCIHPLIMNYRQVIQQTIQFLQHGCFERSGTA